MGVVLSVVTLLRGDDAYEAEVALRTELSPLAVIEAMH